MIVRIASALIALPFVLYLIYFGGLPFTALIVAVGAVCLFEMTNMTMPHDRPAQIAVTILGVLMMLAIFAGFLPTPRGLAIGALIAIAILVFFLFHYGEMSTVAQRIGAAFLSLVWAGLLLAGVGLLRQLPEGGAWVLMACVLAWGSDTGAYFAGKFLGKKKLYPSVSPNKTWAGAVGGVVSATILAAAFQKWLGPAIPLEHLLILAPIGTVLGQLGDLAESLLKRSVGVKDSGKIMPGHGGLLDRIDALLFTGPFLLAYALFVSGLTPEWLVTGPFLAAH